MEEPEYSLELNAHIENLLGAMHGYIRDGEKFLPPMYLLVHDASMNKEPIIKRWHLHDNEDDFPQIMLDAADVQIMQYIRENPMTRFVLIGYTSKENNQRRIYVEAYGDWTQGAFVLSHLYSGFGEDADLEMKDLKLEHFAGHNPKRHEINRSGRYLSGFDLREKYGN